MGLTHFQIEIDGTSGQACCFDRARFKNLSSVRSKVTCLSCKRSLGYRKANAACWNITVSVSTASDRVKTWLKNQPNRSGSIVEALEYYLEDGER